MIEALATKGFVVLDDVLPRAQLQALQQSAQQLLALHAKAAGTGRGFGHGLDAVIRQDHIVWLDDKDAASVDYLTFMEQLRQQLNQQLYLGLFHFECHYACYEPGACYHQHLDAFKGERNRLLSTVFYLNQDWQAHEGGELWLYDLEGQTVVQRVLPQQNRLVLFMSEEFPHEVRPATRQRYSIAGWFKGAV
jgi:SM-20-related protein